MFAQNVFWKEHVKQVWYKNEGEQMVTELTFFSELSL